MMLVVGVARGEKAERLRRAGAGTVIEDYADLDGFTAALDGARAPG